MSTQFCNNFFYLLSLFYLVILSHLPWQQAKMKYIQVFVLYLVNVYFSSSNKSIIFNGSSFSFI